MAGFGLISDLTAFLRAPAYHHIINRFERREDWLCSGISGPLQLIFGLYSVFY